MKNNLSKEEIINLAIKFHLQGNTPEAKKYYEELIRKGYKDKRVFSNYGVILQDLGKFDQAEISYRKAIKIDPNHANAYSNLGSILKKLGKLKEAELYTRKAIKLDPNHSNAYLNLGNILRDLGKLKEAELYTRKAIKLDPNHSNAYLNLGNILRDLGKLKDAETAYRKAIKLNAKNSIAQANIGLILNDLGKSQEAFDFYLKAIEIKPTPSNIYSHITRFLRDSDLSQLSKLKLKKILNILLDKNDVNHKELFKAFNFLYSDEITSILGKLDTDFSKIELLINDKVIINALKKVTFKDIRIEKFLTKVRRKICDRIAENKKTISYYELEFIIALGEQCFLNEYVYSLTEGESLALNTIINRCKDTELNETNISILSCYFPLYKLIDQIPLLESFNSPNRIFKDLIKLQIIEPLKEIELSKNILKIGSINDDISRKVKSQYERNPYPRWRYGSNQEGQQFSVNKAINIEIKPNYINENRGEQQLKILIAGCGTGNQILQSQRFNNAQITSIDLSLSSLSYAQRKIDELKINNVKLIQMDILEVNLLDEKFDIILCSGVLHHMDNPLVGLKRLLGVLKPNGFLKLGLYSELARQDIVKARNYITTNNLKSNDEDIRSFRENVFSGKIAQIRNLKNWGNFYTMSECRDLCFHIKEHRLTMKQLQETLKSNELKFLGFLLPKQIKSVYMKYFPEDKTQTNLQNWAKFEEKNPMIFTGMYEFWVSKNNLKTMSI